jgi:hypothetical protein
MLGLSSTTRMRWASSAAEAIKGLPSVMHVSGPK